MNETTLTVLLTLKDQLSGGVAKAESELSGLASGGISTAGRALNSLESAAGHAKATLGGLAGSMLGQLGIGYGLMKISGFLEDAIGNTEQFGEAVLELHTLTGETAESLSGLAGAMQATGVSGEAALKSLGMAFKMVGKMTSDQEIAFVTQYGMSLRTSAVSAQQLADAEAVLSDKTASAAAQAAALTTVNTYLAGSYKDTNDLVLQAADYYNSTASAEDKAAALSKEFGRGWQTLIPLFTQGADGIRELEQTAADMGLTITTENLPAIEAMKEANEKWKTSMSGLQLQIGLALLPALSNLATQASAFVSGHEADIVGFFKSAADFAGELGDVLTNDVMPVLSTLAGWWGSIPKEFQELLIAGFVTQKASSMLFGGGGIIGGTMGLLGGIGPTGAGDIAGAAAGLGETPLHPMYVEVVGGLGALAGAGEGAVAGEAGAAEGAAAGGLGVKIMSAVPFVIAAASLAALAYTFMNTFGPGGSVNQGQAQTDTQISTWGKLDTSMTDNTAALKAEMDAWKGMRSTPGVGALAGAFANSQEQEALIAAANKLAAGSSISPEGIQALKDALALAKSDPTLSGAITQLDTDYRKAMALPGSDAAAKKDAGIVSDADTGTLTAIKGSASNQTAELTKLTALQRTLLAQGDTKTAASIGADLEKLRTALGEINAGQAALASKPYPPIFVTINSDGSTAKDVSSAQTTRYNYKGTVAS
jgi:hypothetical protein